MPWKPEFPGERPSLGFQVIDWMMDCLAAPDRVEYEPFVPTREQAAFLLSLYELDPRSGRRKYRRAVISRPKGWGKSPLLSAVVLAECLAPVVPDGWDAYGRPVARPWACQRTRPATPGALSSRWSATGRRVRSTQASTRWTRSSHCLAWVA
jgi:hypothetical protein